MTRKKILLLIIILFSLTGCTVEYNVEINTNSIKEDNIVYINNSNKDNIKQKVEELVNNYTGPTNSLGMYEQTIVEKNNNFGMSYKKEYSDIEDYNNSLSFSLCYDNYKLIKEKEKIIISTSERFNCFNKYKELDNVTINIKSNLDVLSSNADVINDNIYTWHINKENASNKNINIVFKPNTESNKQGKIISAFVLVLLSFIIFGIIILLIRLISKRKNKI